MRHLRPTVIAIVTAITLALSTVIGVRADAVYHTQRIPLQAVGTETGTGFVVNAHANGPRILAHENYSLIGAEPNSAYQVSLRIYVGDPTCSSTPFVVPSEVLHTNAAGNAQAKHVFVPADAAGLRGATHGIQWQLTLDGTVAFETSCSAVALD